MRFSKMLGGHKLCSDAKNWDILMSLSEKKAKTSKVTQNGFFLLPSKSGFVILLSPCGALTLWNKVEKTNEWSLKYLMTERWTEKSHYYGPCQATPGNKIDK